MKRNMKKLMIFVLVLTILSQLRVSATGQGVLFAGNEKAFEKVLNENNISVTGKSGFLSHFALQGLIDGIQSEQIKQKYEDKLAETFNGICLTPEEVVEIEFYSMSEQEQKGFLEKTKNQEIQVEIKDEIILISYNPNEELG